MLGNKIRTRVAQAGVVTSATVINLAGGAAVAGHKTFVQGFNITAGVTVTPMVPVLIEKADLSWQVAVGTFTADVGGGTYTFTLDALYESSNANNAAITLTNPDPVTISIAPVAALFSGLVTTPRLPADAATSVGGSLPALAAGKGAYAFGTHSSAIGSGITSANYGAALFGVGGDAYFEYGVHAVPGKKTNAFGLGLTHAVCPAFMARHIRTTNATVTPLDSIDDAEAAINLAFFCEAGMTYFSAVVMAVDSAGAVRRSWKLEWTVSTAQDYSSSALLGSLTKTNLYNGDGSAAAWDVTVTVNSGANTSQIEVTGAAATNIAWAAKIDALVNGLF